MASEALRVANLSQKMAADSLQTLVQMYDFGAGSDSVNAACAVFMVNVNAAAAAAAAAMAEAKASGVPLRCIHLTLLQPSDVNEDVHFPTPVTIEEA